MGRNDILASADEDVRRGLGVEGVVGEAALLLRPQNVGDPRDVTVLGVEPLLRDPIVELDRMVHCRQQGGVVPVPSDDPFQRGDIGGEIVEGTSSCGATRTSNS